MGGVISLPEQQPRSGYQGGGNSYGEGGQGHQHQQQLSQQNLQPQVPEPAHGYHGQVPGPVQHRYHGPQPGQVLGPAQHGYVGQQPGQVQSYSRQFVQQGPPVGQQYGVITQNRFAVEGFAGSNYSN